jgi:hypothetical protein
MPIDRKRIFVKVPVNETPVWSTDEDVASHPKSWSDYDWMFEVPTWATNDDIKEYILLMNKYADWSEAEDEEFTFWRSKDRDHGDGRYN